MKVYKILIRVLLLPFVFPIFLISCIIGLLKCTYNYLTYGIEIITLEKTNNKKTISNTYDLLEEFLKKSNK
jgi:hypothetical protein